MKETAHLKGRRTWEDNIEMEYKEMWLYVIWFI
jgi:hypothetical protein